MSLKLGLNLTRYYSINFDLPKRNKKKIIYIILHYTGMKKETQAIERLCDSQSKVSSHYFVKNNGKVLNLIPDLYTAWHAGKSNWKSDKSLNKKSIGIEIANKGHQFGYQNYSKKQIKSLIKLSKYLIKKYNITKNNILGHSDIAFERKKDPGEKFPWKLLSKKNIGIWHKVNEKKLKKIRNKNISKLEKEFFFKLLSKIGYFVRTIKASKKILLVKSFQRHFRQKLINGKIDQECLLIAKKLSKFEH